MATVPSEVTAVAGTVLTASTWNSNVRDGINFILSPPLAMLRQTVAQSVASGAYASLLLDTEEIDRDNGHSTATNTSRYVSQTAGWYDCVGYVSFANNTGVSAARAARLAVNGTPKPGRTTYQTNQASNDAWAGPAVGSVYLSVGDYLEVQGLQFTGAALNTICDSNFASALTVRWIST